MHSRVARDTVPDDGAGIFSTVMAEIAAEAYPKRVISQANGAKNRAGNAPA